MNKIFRDHWDKLIGFFMSIVVAGLIGYYGARVGLIDRINATETRLLDKIDIKADETGDEIEKIRDVQSDNGKNIVKILTSTDFIKDKQSDFAGTMRGLDAKLEKIDGELENIGRDVIEIRAQNN